MEHDIWNFIGVQNLSYRLTRLKRGQVILALSLCQNIKTVYGVADEVEPCSWCKLLKESEGLNAVGNECLALQLRETLVLHDLLRTKRNTNIKTVEGVVLILKNLKV